VTSNADKQPISGATVQIKGTKTATQTGSDGTFSISSSKDIGILVVTVVGFEPLQIPVNGRASVGEITLALSISNLNDVVVTGYTAQKKKDIIGAIAIVDVKNMKAVPLGNPDAMLQGQAAGVTVVTTGSPGGQSDILIRGVTSFGDNTPLVMIDGVQASLHDINPNDIESIQVLKDAGASSIYGVRAANGVIIVTTKRGKSGKMQLSYDGFYGTQKPLSGNVWHSLGSQELANALWIADRNSGNLTNGNPFSQQYGNGANPILPDYISPAGAKEGDSSTNPALYNIDYTKGPIYFIEKANKSGTDWFHTVFRPAPIQSHTVSASGGTDKSSYLFSVGYFDQQGTLISTYLKRYDVRVNTSFTPRTGIRLGENAYFFYKENPNVNNNSGTTGSGNINEGVIATTYREQPIIPQYDIMGNYGGSNGKELGNSSSPYADQDRLKNDKAYVWDVIGNIWGEVDFLKHFTARSSFGGTLDNGYYYNFQYRTYENAENNSSNGFGENAYYNTTWTWTNSISYSQVFAEKHSLKLLGGVENVYNYGRGVGGFSLNYFTTDPNYWTLGGGSGTPTNYSFAYQAGLNSLFGRLDYSYNDRYYLSGTLRRDGSSVFGSKSRYGTFPSVSAGWRVSQESFMQDVTWLNELKIRGSYGVLGNKNNVPGGNAYTQFGQGFGSTYYSITGSTTGIVQGFAPAQYGNANTSWEQDKLTNIGFDANLAHNKFNVTVEWYQKKSTGLLFNDVATYIGLGGANPPVVNIGTISNKGWDISAGYHGTAGRDFKYSITASITTYHSNVESIPGGGYFDGGGSRIGSLVRNQVGHPVSAFFGYKVIGYFQDANDVAKSPTQQDAAPGRFKYADVNGDGKIDQNDRAFLGNPNPDFTYGLNLNASYKGWDFTMIFYGSHGNDILNYVKYWTNFWASFQGGKSKDLLYNSWTPANLHPAAPILENASTFSTNTIFNSYYIEKGSFLKCKSLIIGYTLPEKTLKSIKLDRVRIYGQITNPFMITGYSGLDPEVPNSQNVGSSLQSNGAYGIDYGIYPSNQRNFIVGVSLGF
jgi:TonB-linked SusC/RagA family outer membrane protein